MMSSNGMCDAGGCEPSRRAGSFISSSEMKSLALTEISSSAGKSGNCRGQRGQGYKKFEIEKERKTTSQVVRTVTSLFTAFLNISATLSAWNGGMPTRNSYAITPSAHQSTAKL